MSFIGLYSLQKLHMIENHLRQIRRFKSKNIDFQAPVMQKYLNYLVFQNESLLSKDERSPQELTRLYEIKPVVNVLVQKIFLQENINFLKEQREVTSDDIVKKTIAQETEIYDKRLKVLEQQVKSALLDPVLTYNGVLLEIDANDGKHASTLVQELLDMYKSYARHKAWDFEIASVTKSKSGIKNVTMVIEGFGVHELMKLEVGKHERKSAEKTTTMHDLCSTAIVTVIPVPNDLQYDIPSEEVTITTKDELDLKTKKIKHSSVIVTHNPSNTVVECKQNKSNDVNEHIAMKKLKAILYEVVRMCDLVDENAKIDSDIDNFAKTQTTVRTYDHSRDKVIDNRNEENDKIQLKAFLTSGEHLDHLQYSLLRKERYKAVISDIEKFEKKCTAGTDDVFTLY